MLRNQQLFAALEKNVAGAVLQAVMKAAHSGDGTAGQIRLLAGATLVEVARAVLAVVARYGMSFVENNTIKQLTDQLTETLSAGLERAAKELGRRMDQADLPEVLAALIRKLLRGEISNADPKSENFKKLFSELADAAAN